MTIDLVFIASAIIAAIGGVVPFTQWLKGVLGWSGWKAFLLNAVLSVIGAVLTLWADGQLLPGTIGWENFLEVFMLVIGVAQGFYFAVSQFAKSVVRLSN
jgi:hypothetical protein